MNNLLEVSMAMSECEYVKYVSDRHPLTAHGVSQHIFPIVHWGPMSPAYKMSELPQPGWESMRMKLFMNPNDQSHLPHMAADEHNSFRATLIEFEAFIHRLTISLYLFKSAL